MNHLPSIQVETVNVKSVIDRNAVNIVKRLHFPAWNKPFKMHEEKNYFASPCFQRSQQSAQVSRYNIA